MNYLFNGIFITAFLAVIVSCDVLFLTHVTVDFDYAEFHEEKLLWYSSKPDNYQYYLEDWNNGFSVPVSTLIIAENGVYKTQIPCVDDYGYSYESYWYLTITDIYESIESEYREYHNTRQNKNNSYLQKIEIKYGAENHIPVEIQKYYYVPENLADAASYSETKITKYKINE
jgi:hypothetical protein